MEDAFKFLLVAAVIVIGIVKQLKKEAQKKAANKPATPMPDTDTALPENWGGDTYGGYIPEGPRPETAAAGKMKNSDRQSKPSDKTKSFTSHTSGASSYRKAQSAASIKQNPPPTELEPQEPETSEFGIHSAEEARQAIIWSEILQRKY